MDRGSIDAFEINFKSKFRNLNPQFYCALWSLRLALPPKRDSCCVNSLEGGFFMKTYPVSVIGLLLGLPARLAWGQPQHQPTVDAPKQEPSAEPPAVAPESL